MQAISDGLQTHRSNGSTTLQCNIEFFIKWKKPDKVCWKAKTTDGYIQGDTALFEQIAEQTGVFNRLIIYRHHALHSGVITKDTRLSADPRLGRLTISSFIDPS